MVEPTERVCLGVIAGAHGLKGLVRVRSFTEAPDDIAGYGELSDEAGERLFSLRLAGRAGGALLARIDGVTERTAAEALKGTRLYVARQRLPATAPGEFYYADLIGLAVEFPDGTAVGTVRGVDNHGAGDVLEIAVEPAGPMVSVPFTRAAVPTVDLADGRVVVNPLPGLFAAANDGDAGQ